MSKLIDAAIAAGATVSTSDSSDLAPGSILFHSQAQLEAAMQAVAAPAPPDNPSNLPASLGATIREALTLALLTQGYRVDGDDLALARRVHFLSLENRDLINMQRAVTDKLQEKLDAKAAPAFRVTVNPLQASNGLTYLVTLDQGTRPDDAMPWDDGRITPINRNDLDEANSEGAEWAKFLGVPFTPCEPCVDTAAVNTVPEYGYASASSTLPPVGSRMDIYARSGTKVVFDAYGGYPSEQERAKKILILGETYVVQSTSVGSSSSSVFLQGIPGGFNTVMFAKLDTPEQARELTDEAQAERDDFERNYNDCSCHLSPPCGSCTHPGNPINQDEDPTAWKALAIPAPQLGERG